MAEENYLEDAQSDALSTIENFLDETVEQLREKGEASDDLLNDYSDGDSYHHENHVDKSYTLLESAQILDQLHRYEETDSGLWEGSEPRKAIEIQAAYTYGNAVYNLWRHLIGELNKEFSSFRPRQGPKEWSPKKRNGPGNIKEFVEYFIKERK